MRRHNGGQRGHSYPAQAKIGKNFAPPITTKRTEKQKNTDSGAFPVAGAGLEPATSGLRALRSRRGSRSLRAVKRP